MSETYYWYWIWVKSVQPFFNFFEKVCILSNFHKFWVIGLKIGTKSEYYRPMIGVEFGRNLSSRFFSRFLNFSKKSVYCLLSPLRFKSIQNFQLYFRAFNDLHKWHELSQNYAQRLLNFSKTFSVTFLLPQKAFFR